MTAGLLQPHFVSLRWRVALPLVVVLLIITMAGAYVLGQNLTAAASSSQSNLLVQLAEAVRLRANDLYERSVLEAQRIAFTRGVVDAVSNRAASELQPILESNARLADLDSVVITDEQGTEIVGILRVEQNTQMSYSVSTNTDLHVQSVVRSVLDDKLIGASGLLRTPQGLMLYTAVPLNVGEQLTGIILVGRALDKVLTELKADGIADLTVYSPEFELLQSTLPPTDTTAAELSLPADALSALSTSKDQLFIRDLTRDNQLFQAGFATLHIGTHNIGIFAILLPDTVPAISQTGQQLGALTFSALAGAAVIGIFVALYILVIHPTGQIASVASELAAGNPLLRTGMHPVNEIAALGHALDLYADYAQERQDALRASLRRQRRELEYFQSILESMQDGVIVHDHQGQIIVMNQQARVLLKTQPYDKLGLATNSNQEYKPLAPGMYTLGDPRRLEWDGHMVSAQATAIMNLADQQVGTLVVLRDITKEIMREQLEERMLKRLADEAQVRLPVSQVELSSLPMKEVAVGLSRHAGALQKLIYEMREMTLPDVPPIREIQSPLYLDTLIWVIANEWRQIATAANLSLEVLIEKSGLFVLGDERRLRWAVGNLVDNAIKYTPSGGKLTLEINGEADGQALMRVRDNGVGISREDAQHLSTRFFRGTPRLPDGEPLQVPGMGQGLYVAKLIIEAHGGMLQIKSKPGVGTAAYFTLPVTSPQAYQLPLLQHLDHDGETVRVKERK